MPGNAVYKIKGEWLNVAHGMLLQHFDDFRSQSWVPHEFQTIEIRKEDRGLLLHSILHRFCSIIIIERRNDPAKLMPSTCRWFPQITAVIASSSHRAMPLSIQMGCKAKNGITSLVGKSAREHENSRIVWSLTKFMMIILCCFDSQINFYICALVICTWKTYQSISPACQDGRWHRQQLNGFNGSGVFYLGTHFSPPRISARSSTLNMLMMKAVDRLHR